MQAITVTIDPAAIYDGYNKTLADLILEECSRKILEDFHRDEALNDLRKRVQQIRDEQIVQAIQPTIDEAISAALQPTDAFGQAKGDPKTLREVIIERAVDYLKKPIQGASYGKASTVVEKFIEEAVTNAVARDLKTAFEEGHAQIREAIKVKGAEVLEQVLVQMAKERG